MIIWLQQLPVLEYLAEFKKDVQKFVKPTLWILENPGKTLK